LPAVGKGMGQHHLAREIIKGIPGLSDDVRDVMMGFTSGPFHKGHAHLYDNAHRQYNQEVARILRKAIQEGTITPSDLKDPSKAIEWIKNLSKGLDPVTGDPNKILSKYVNEHIKPFVNDLLVDNDSVDAIIKRGRSIQNSILQNELRNSLKTIDGLSDSPADKRRFAELQKKIRRLQEQLNAVRQRMNLPNPTGVMKRAGKILKNNPIRVGGTLGTMFLLMNVERDLEAGMHPLEVAGRNAPVVGDFVSAAIDISAIYDAAMDLDYEGDQAARQVALDDAVAASSIKRILEDIHSEVSEIEYQYNHDPTPGLQAAYQELVNDIEDAHYRLPIGQYGDNTFDPEMVEAARQKFKDRLHQLGFRNTSSAF